MNLSRQEINRLLFLVLLILIGCYRCHGVTNQTEIVNFTVTQHTNGEYMVNMVITNTVPGAKYTLYRNANSIPYPIEGAFILPLFTFTATNTFQPFRVFQTQPVHFYRVQNQ